MRRPLTLLALLGLASCTADLPTAPGAAEEALTFALPPVPPPPTPLSATLPGANGAPILLDLGVWEASTLAKITVSGMLSYSGATGGYYAPAGSHDFQGRYVPAGNLCASQLSVRIHGVGPVGGAFGYCPATWQSLGSRTTYAVLKGAIYATRTSPAPGACFYGTAGCATISGSQEVTITPVEGSVAVLPETTIVRPGVHTRVKFRADPVQVGGVGLPFTLREVTFVGSGPVVGGGTTKVCGTKPTPTECIGQFYQSGYVEGTALVSGVLRTGRAWITVVGGDSVPPPPVDTVPTDTIPTDTLPGGGGGGGCAPEVAGGVPAATCEPVVVPVPIIACSPGTVVRGTAVNCLVLLLPSKAFTIDSLVATAGPHTIRFQGPYHVPEDSSFSVAGPALLGTSMVVWVSVDSGGTPVSRTAAGSFAVTARQWTELDQLWPSPQVKRYTLDPRPTALDLSPRVVGTGFAFTPGVFEEAFPDWGGMFPNASEVVEGPNRGLVYLSQEVRFAGSPAVYTTPAFQDTIFLQDQNGGPGGQYPRCTRSQLTSRFIPEVERHEGATMAVDSHWGLWRTELGALGLNRYAESLVYVNSPSTDIVDSVVKRYDQWYRHSFTPAIRQFETVDRPRVPANAGCELDLDNRDR